MQHPKLGPGHQCLLGFAGPLAASSNPKHTNAFRLWFLASIRLMKASTTSTGDSSCRRIRPASSVAVV